jgi:hypothetical protein
MIVRELEIFSTILKQVASSKMTSFADLVIV